MSKAVRSFRNILSLVLGGWLASCGCPGGALAQGAGEPGREWRQPPFPRPANPVQEPSHITVQVRPATDVLGQAFCIYGSLTDSSGRGLASRAVHLTVLSPEGKPEIFTAGTDTNGEYILYYVSSSAGKDWKATSSWPGDGTYAGASADSPAVFDVQPAETEIDIRPSAYALFWTDTVGVSGRLKATTSLPAQSNILGGQNVSLHFLKPDGQTATPVSAATDPTGGYAFQGLLLREVGVWELWTEFGGNADLRASSSQRVRVQVKKAAGYAIIVSGRGDNDTALDSRNRTADLVYRKLLSRGFAAENIIYLRFGVPEDNGILVDGLPGKEAIQNAVATWASERMIAEPAPLFIVFIGPGKRRQFYISGGTESVTPWELNGWVTKLERSLEGSSAAGQPITFIYGTPYGGSFIYPLSSKGNPRVVITSSDPNELPVSGPEEDAVARQGEFFVLELFESLARGLDVMRSFEKAAGATRLYTRNLDGNGLNAGLVYPDLGAHHPLLDDNGDGIGSFGFLSAQPGDDGFLSSRIILGYGEARAGAQVVEVSPKQVIFPGENPNLWAKVNDRNAVGAVWMLIKPPSFSMGSVSGELSLHRDVGGIHVPLLDPDGDAVYSPSFYPPFTEPGTYRVLFFVKDNYTGQLGEIWKTNVTVFDPLVPSPGEFSILFPEDGATVGRQVLLRWSASQKGRPDDEITYAVQVASDPSFVDIVLERNDIEGTSLVLSEEAGLLDRTTYYWRVRAESSFGKARFASGTAMKSTDVGQILQGSTLYDPSTDSYTILGDGLDSFGAEDQFRFIHTSASGSFEVSARLDSLEETSSSALAGIMIRQRMDGDSPYAMVAVNADRSVLFASRGTPGSLARVAEYDTIALPGYLKLVCVRSSADGSAEITPYFSPDGQKWYPGKSVSLLMPGDVQVGICVLSGDLSRLVKAQISRFSISLLTDRPLGTTDGSFLEESALFAGAPPAEPLGSEYGTFTTNYGAGLPGYNVLTVLVYNRNDPSQSPPGTTITISPIVGTINNWMYSGYVPVGEYTIDVAAPNFSSERRMTEVTAQDPATEVFTLVPNAGSVSGKVVSSNDLSNIRGATVQLQVTSGIYFGTIYGAVTGTDGTFVLSALPAAINYETTVSKNFYGSYQAPFALGAGESKNLGTISLGFTDADSDGLPDEFEQGIVDFDPADAIDDITDVHGGDDFDGDSQTNWQECVAGTDPTSASSRLRIVSIVSNTSNAFTVTWTSASGVHYCVYYGGTVGVWSLADSDMPASGTGRNCWSDDDGAGTTPPPGGTNIRFYRVEAY